MEKRAQGLALNTIIIAILVVVVLVVVILLFVGTMSGSSKAITQHSSAQCAEAGGFCTSSSFCQNIQGKELTDKGCPNNQVCCVPKAS